MCLLSLFAQSFHVLKKCCEYACQVCLPDYVSSRQIGIAVGPEPVVEGTDGKKHSSVCARVCVCVCVCARARTRMWSAAVLPV